MAVHRRAKVTLLSLVTIAIHWTSIRSINEVRRRRRQQDLNFGGGRYSYNANPWLGSSLENDDETHTSSKISKGTKSLTTAKFSSPTKTSDPKLPDQPADASGAKQSALPTPAWRSSPAPLAPSAVPHYIHGVPTQTQPSLYPGVSSIQNRPSHLPSSSIRAATRNPSSQLSTAPSARTPKMPRQKDARPISLPSWPGSPPASSPLTSTKPFPGVTVAPSNEAEPTAEPSSVAGFAILQNYSIEPSPFLVTYFTASSAVPTQSDLDQAESITLGHIKYCIGEQYNEPLDVALHEGSTDPLMQQGNAMRIEFHILCDFLASSSHVPNTSAVDSVLETCFSGISRKRLLTSLTSLPDENPFSTTQSLTYAQDAGLNKSIETSSESNNVRTLSMIAIAGMIVAAVLFSVASAKAMRNTREKHDRTVRPRYCRRDPARRVKEYASRFRLLPRHQGSNFPTVDSQSPYPNDMEDVLQTSTLVHCKVNVPTVSDDRQHKCTRIQLQNPLSTCRSAKDIFPDRYQKATRHGRTLQRQRAQSKLPLDSSDDGSWVSDSE